MKITFPAFEDRASSNVIYEFLSCIQELLDN